MSHAQFVKKPQDPAEQVNFFLNIGSGGEGEATGQLRATIDCKGIAVRPPWVV